MPCVKLTLLVPAPSAEPPAAGARVPKESLQVPGLAVAYRNQPVVAAPPGFAVPLSVAVAPVSAVGELVLTTGRLACVVNDSTAPKVVPYVFLPIAQ